MGVLIDHVKPDRVSRDRLGHPFTGAAQAAPATRGNRETSDLRHRYRLGHEVTGAARRRPRNAGGTVKRLIQGFPVVAVALLFAACDAPGASAFAPRAAVSADRAAALGTHTVQVTGGGTTTFGADLDGDGDVDASHFGFAAVIAGDGSAQGDFTCLMAVQGPVTSGAQDGRSFSGTATVEVLNAFGPGVQSIFRDIPFAVAVTPGGAGVATLQLTVFGVFDGVPGDVAPGNHNYDLAKETLTTGQITIH